MNKSNLYGCFFVLDMGIIVLEREKLMKLLFACSILAISLTGCARIGDVVPDKGKKEEVVTKEDYSKKEKNFVCKKGEDTIHFEVEDDRINNFTQVFYLNLEDLQIPKNLKAEEIQRMVDNALKEMCSKFLGVSVEGEYVDGRVKISAIVNYEVADIDALVEAGFLDSGEIESQYVSFKRTEKDLESQGYACEVAE